MKTEHNNSEQQVHGKHHVKNEWFYYGELLRAKVEGFKGGILILPFRDKRKLRVANENTADNRPQGRVEQ